MVDQEPRAAAHTEDDRTVRLLAQVEAPSPDAAFVRRLRDMLLRSCPAT